MPPLSEKQELQRLLFPAAGNRNNSDGNANNRGNNGNYWSSRSGGSDAYYLSFGSSYTDVNDYNNNYRANGSSVRCVQVTDEVAEL